MKNLLPLASLILAVPFLTACPNNCDPGAIYNYTDPNGTTIDQSGCDQGGVPIPINPPPVPANWFVGTEIVTPSLLVFPLGGVNVNAQWFSDLPGAISGGKSWFSNSGPGGVIAVVGEEVPATWNLAWVTAPAPGNLCNGKDEFEEIFPLEIAFMLCHLHPPIGLNSLASETATLDSMNASGSSNGPPPVIENVCEYLGWYQYASSTTDHYYTTACNITPYGYINTGTTFYVYQSPIPNTSPVYSLYNLAIGKHKYTVSQSEFTSLLLSGWRNQGILGYVFTSSSVPLPPGTTAIVPIHDLIDPAQDSIYTLLNSEIAAVLPQGYVEQPITMYSPTPPIPPPPPLPPLPCRPVKFCY